MLKAIHHKIYSIRIVIALLTAGIWFLSLPLPAAAGAFGGADPGGYGLKIYRVNSGLYPYVQVYFEGVNNFV